MRNISADMQSCVEPAIALATTVTVYETLIHFSRKASGLLVLAEDNAPTVASILFVALKHNQLEGCFYLYL